MNKFKVIIAGLSIAALSACGGGSSGSSCQGAEAMLELVNQARTQGQFCGSAWYPPVGTLTISDYLQGTASYFANDLAANEIPAGHVDSQGREFSQRVQGYAGENSAMGTDGVNETIQGFLGSPSHCVNLMHSTYTKFGSSCAVNKDTAYWVQHFSK